MNRRDMGQRVSRKKKGVKHAISKVQIPSLTEVPNHKVMLVRDVSLTCPNPSLVCFMVHGFVHYR